ncbi:MAG: flagellar hook-associated protein FlgK, partial [Alphaproteobacteria bacterium]|nr:flagellar hook-associated protein FlgK [Alphaproteobacteria bacterium]
MALIQSLGTSLTGMKAAQNQLDIISRNIANVDTVGYSRKVAQQHNVVRAGYSMGVSVGNIGRQVDQGLLKSYLSSNALTNNYSS